MSKNEIIVNCYRNPEKKINIDIELKNRENLIDCNTLTIKKNEVEEEEIKKNNYYFFYNSISSDNSIGLNIINLIFKDINIDISKSNFYFKSLKTLLLNNSLINLSKKNIFCSFEKLENITIKGDLNIIKYNLLNLKNNNILNLINLITIKMVSKSSSKLNIFNIFKILNIYISQIKNSFNFYFKGLLSDLEINKIEKLNNNIFSKIKKISLFSLNKINSKTGKIIKEELIDKINNLEELYINDNIICDNDLEKKMKLFSCINNTEEININYNLYDINKLSKISLSICEYKKNKKSLLLYGEANMSFYNSNNKEFLINLINNNHKGKLSLLSLCNFDMENIDYLNDLIKKCINNTEKLNIQNLNINKNFISLIKEKNLFNTSNLSIENIIFHDEETENKFYEFINNYNNCKTLKLISLEDIGKYKNIIINNNLNKLLLEEIYDINYKLLYDLIKKRNSNFSNITLKNLEINEEDDKNIIIDIIDLCKNDIKKLKIISPNFNFIFKVIQEKKIEFKKLEKLILYLDKENENEIDEKEEKNNVYSDKDKISFLENNCTLLNYKNIKKIDLEMFSVSLNDKEKIMKIYNNLYELY